MSRRNTKRKGAAAQPDEPDLMAGQIPEEDIVKITTASKEYVKWNIHKPLPIVHENFDEFYKFYQDYLQKKEAAAAELKKSEKQKVEKQKAELRKAEKQKKGDSEL